MGKIFTVLLLDDYQPEVPFDELPLKNKEKVEETKKRGNQVLTSEEEKSDGKSPTVPFPQKGALVKWSKRHMFASSSAQPKNIPKPIAQSVLQDAPPILPLQIVINQPSMPTPSTHSADTTQEGSALSRLKSIALVSKKFRILVGTKKVHLASLPIVSIDPHQLISKHQTREGTFFADKSL